MADKKCFLDKDYTRRQFLKLSGKSLAGLALSTSMLSAMGVTEKAVAEDKVRVWAFPQGLLVVNASVAQPASNSGYCPNCRCPAQSETSATYDILSAFASQQPPSCSTGLATLSHSSKAAAKSEASSAQASSSLDADSSRKKQTSNVRPFHSMYRAVLACPLFSFFRGY